MSAHTIEVAGRTFEHKDTLKTSFKLWWKVDSWKGKYRVGSPLLPRLISYCAKNKLRLLVDGESTATDQTESEFDYQNDFEQQTIKHTSVNGGGSPLQGFSLPVETKSLGYEVVSVKPSNASSDWERFQSILGTDTPYTEARQEQQHLLPLIADKLQKGYKNVIVECPTGSGKSALAYWLPLVFDNSVYISTPLKGLQSQYIQDHPFMSSAMGRGNYECALTEEELEELDLENCSAANAPCRVIEGFDCPHALKQTDIEEVMEGLPFETSCGYYDAYAEALKNRWFIGNTTYLTAMKMFGKPTLPTRPLLVVDEAHTTAATIEKFCGFSLSRKRIARLLYGKKPSKQQTNESRLNHDFPSIKSMRVDTPDNERRADCIQILLMLRALVKEVEINLKHRKYRPDEMADAKAFVQHAYMMLSELQHNWKKWVYQFDDDGVKNVLRVEPLSVSKYAEDCFLSLGNQRVFMSGTIVSPEVFMEELGLNPDESVYLKITESTFPSAKRPLALSQKGGLMIWNKEAQGIQFSDLKKTAEAVAKIAKHYEGHKGLILPYTDGIESAIVDILSDHHPETAARLVQHTKNPKERDETLHQFKEGDGDGILISTYANQGYDNPDIRFVIICKLPFLSLGDTKVRLKMQNNEEWYQTYTVRTLLQQYGRAMRSKDDWGHVYVVDAHFKHWFKTRKIERLVPTYIMDAMR